MDGFWLTVLIIIGVLVSYHIVIFPLLEIPKISKKLSIIIQLLYFQSKLMDKDNLLDSEDKNEHNNNA